MTMQLISLFAEQSYAASYAVYFLFVLLGACAIAIPRFRTEDPLAKKKAIKNRKK